MGEVTEVRAPVENVNDETIAIIRWLVENGSRVEKGDPLVLAETSKTSFDVPAPVSGFVWQVAVADTDVPTGAVLCYIGEALEHARAAAASGGVIPDTGRPVSQTDVAGHLANVAPPEAAPARFSSKAAALIHELGIDSAAFAGRGLVREQDVLAYRDRVAHQSSAGAPPTGTTREPAPPAGGPLPALGVPTRAEKLSRNKRTEIRHLRAGWAGTLPSSVSVAVPTAGFFSAAQDDGALGLASAAVIFEMARLLRQYPLFNAYYVDGVAHYYEQVNVGYAVDLGNGLKVPVIRNADRKSLNEIVAEKQQYLVDYINDALPVESLAGGTFTVSDLSGEGVLHFQPLINEGQSAILGVCAEFFGAASSVGTYNLVLAFDHQLADGRAAASLLRDLRERLTAHEASLVRPRDDSVAPGEPRCAICLRPVSELEGNRHFLVRTVAASRDQEQAVCTICLEDW